MPIRTILDLNVSVSFSFSAIVLPIASGVILFRRRLLGLLACIIQKQIETNNIRTFILLQKNIKFYYARSTPNQLIQIG